MSAVAIVTSIHPDFDARVWKHALMAARAGFEVHLICPWSVRGVKQVSGVHFHPFRRAPSRILRPIWNLLVVMPKVLGIMRRVDLIHFHDFDLLPLMTPLALFRRVVFDVHENYPDEVLEKAWIPKVMRRPISIGVRLIQGFCTRVIRNVVLVAPSQERYFSDPRLRKIYIYNFASKVLAESVTDNYEEREPTVVFIGSQHANNGSLLLLNVASKVAASGATIRFIAVDRFFDPVFRDQFLRERSRLRLEGVVQLVPNVKPQDLMSILNMGTIGVSPNLRVAQQINGIHTKLFEYMAAGLPMIVSDLPHQVEVIRASNGGIAVPPEDPAAIARAILDLTASPVRAREMGRLGQAAFLNHYCYESQQASLSRFYGEILGNTA